MFWKSKNKTVEQLIDTSGTDKFVSIFGKSTVPSDTQSYQLTKAVTKLLLERGCGVIHGGYAGGIMQAVADQAEETIFELKLPPERNIAVPQQQHDTVGWERVPVAQFSIPAPDVYDRLRMMVKNSAFAIVGPRGGDGTMLELIMVWHENVINEALGLKTIPLIVLQSADGTNWTRLLESMVNELDNGVSNVGEIKWLHIYNSLDSFSADLGSFLELE
jgi:predicted Rossmann-fold nucleotide-binding protein